MIGLASVSNLIKKQTPTYMTLYGGVKNSGAVVKAFTEEACDFLQKHRGQYLSKKEIISFYRSLFPDLRISVKGQTKCVEGDIKKILEDKSTSYSFFERRELISQEKDVLGSLQSVYDKQGKCTKAFELCLPDVKPAGFFKRLFGIKEQNVGKFYVDSEFSDVFTHEGVHLVQLLIKPTDVAYRNILLKHTNGSKVTSDLLEDLSERIFMSNVYCESSWRINSEKFKEGLKRALEGYVFPKRTVRIIDENGKAKKVFLDSSLTLCTDNSLSKQQREYIQKYCPPFWSSRRVIIDQIKRMIRSCVHEKEAYIEGEAVGKKFSKKKLSIEQCRKLASDEINKYYKFDEKIKALRELYFALIEEEKHSIRK